MTLIGHLSKSRLAALLSTPELQAKSCRTVSDFVNLSVYKEIKIKGTIYHLSYACEAQRWGRIAAYDELLSTRTLFELVISRVLLV